MRNLLKLFTLILLFSCKVIDEEIYIDKPQDAIVSAFFGLDNVLPSLFLCNQLVLQLVFSFSDSMVYQLHHQTQICPCMTKKVSYYGTGLAGAFKLMISQGLRG